MSRCVCNNPCTCYFEYDGDRPSTIYTQPYQYGRYSTRKQGSGTDADPYIIEFIDSEEFQVEAAQARTTADQVISSTTSGNVITGFNTIDYETPNEIFMAFIIHITNGNLFPSVHKFWHITAETTFVSNGSASGSRRLHITWNPPADNYGPYSQIIIGGTATTGLPGAEDITLSCSGLLPFAGFTERPMFYGPGGYVYVQAQQNSGANMTIRNSKVTLVSI